MAAGNTYEAIATTTLGSTASSVTFSSIPATYTDLVLVSAPIGNGDAQVNMTFNNDTSAFYSDTLIAGNGSTVTAYRAIQGASIPLDYYFSVTTGVASKSAMAVVGLWPFTSAINRIDLTATSSTFAAGSVFSLYGIKAA